MNIRVVTIESPYDLWNDNLVQELFVKTVGLKLRGYLEEYPYGVLPVDTTDFICNHHLACAEENGVLTPLMGYRSITLDRIKAHHMAFPVLGMLKACELPQHLEAAQMIVNRCEKKKAVLSYDSSWTIDPNARKDEVLTQKLRKVMTAMHTLYHIDRGTGEILSGGSLRFKMEKLFGFWGYRPLSLNGKELSPFKLPACWNSYSFASFLVN